MKNINSDITKFDGKYLKCIVSKYKAITKYLANSGSLIILQPNNEQINKDIVETYDRETNTYSITTKNVDRQYRNYIYLGDEFLASGYGFSTLQYRNSAERIVREYDKQIKDIKDVIDNEITGRTNEDDYIKNNYVLINKGPIENTCVNLQLADSTDTISIPTKDIILYGEEANYDNFEVINCDITIKGPSQYFVQDKIQYYNENTILCPIGSILNYVSVSMETDDKDSGGLSKLRVNHNKIFNPISENSNENVESVIINYDFDYDNKLHNSINVKYNHHKIGYKKMFSQNFIVSNDITNLIKNIYLEIKGTPESNYKFYPGLIKINPNWKIVSSGNAIKDNTIEINKSINLKSQYYGRYFSNLENNSNYYDNTNNCFALKNFNQNDTTNIIFNIPKSNGELSKTVYIEIPSNFFITKLYLLSENNSSKYNISGALKVYRNHDRICQYANTYTKDDDETVNYISTIKYDIYFLNLDDCEYEDVDKININVIYNNTDNNVTETNINELNINLDNSWNYINDEEFNLLYWINGKIVEDASNIEDLKQQIENKAKNGIIKN